MTDPIVEECSDHTAHYDRSDLRLLKVKMTGPRGSITAERTELGGWLVQFLPIEGTEASWKISLPEHEVFAYLRSEVRQ